MVVTLSVELAGTGELKPDLKMFSDGAVQHGTADETGIATIAVYWYSLNIYTVLRHKANCVRWDSFLPQTATPPDCSCNRHQKDSFLRTFHEG